MRIKLGNTVRDVITGFEGIATGRAEYITGCTQYSVQPRVKPDGDVVDARWVDESRLEVTAQEEVELVEEDAPAGPGTPPPAR